MYKFSLLDKEIKLFQKKINQESINYKEKSIMKIFIKYYSYIFYRFIFNNDSSRPKNNSNIVISHVESLTKYDYMNRYKKYIEYKKIPIDFFDLLSEILLSPLYIFSFYKESIQYKNQIFEAYLYSKIILKYIEKNKYQEVVFFGYDYDLTFLFATILLNRKNIKTIQYCNSGFLGIHNLEVANSVYCRTNIQASYMINREDIFRSNKIEYIFPLRIENNKNNKIAIYTSGYYARFKFNFSNFEMLKEGMKAEELIIETMTQYAKLHPKIYIVLFIHLHNGVENIDEAKEYYRNFLSLPNVRLQEEEEKSIDNFSQYNLGICCMSEIFFDRYERGYKTILMNPFILDNFIEQTPLYKVSLYSQEKDIIKQINKFLGIPHKSYFKLLDS